MTRTRPLLLALTLGLPATACEPSAFTGEPTDVTPTAAADGGAEPTPTPTQPVSGCDGSAFPGDPTFAALVCDYQAALIGALADGVDVSDDLRTQVQDALVLWVTDPAGARGLVEAAIAQIESARGAVSPTVTDVADDLFACVDHAAELLQEASDRVEFGGVPIPELDDWRATFDQAAALADAGDVVGATRLLCDLSDEMESRLIQT